MNTRGVGRRKKKKKKAPPRCLPYIPIYTYIYTYLGRYISFRRPGLVEGSPPSNLGIVTTYPFSYRPRDIINNAHVRTKESISSIKNWTSSECAGKIW